MANWCVNHLTVGGNEKEVKEVLKLFTEFEQKTKLGDGIDIVEKSNRPIFDVTIIEGEVTFETKWSPPSKELIILSERFPEVAFTIYYEELGNNLYGVLQCKSGFILVEEDLYEELLEIEYIEEEDAYYYNGNLISSMEYYGFLDEMLNNKTGEI